jgi:hypothetical protein
MAIQNQGFRKDLNLIETENDITALNNIGGAGIANDLRIIQNNLRNISTFSYVSLVDEYFYFGSTSEFVFTNDDIVTVNTDVTVGVTTLKSDEKYYVCNSNGFTQFKLSTTPSSAGVSTILVTSVFPSSFYFIREDAVYRSNIENFISPQIQDTDKFSYNFGNRSVNGVFDYIRTFHENADFSISKKYKVRDDTVSNEIINIEGSVVVQDPSALNTTELSLSNPKSPGVFISNIRAFSSDNNPWTNVGSALSTKSSDVSIEELYLYNNISISGISTESSTREAVTLFTHKLPVVINDETYYLLLRSNASAFIPANVVQNGLNLYLDAGIPQSYPGSGTNWNDLSGNALNASGTAANISSDGAISGASWRTPSTNILDTDTHSIFFMLRMNSSGTYPQGYSGNWDKMFSYNAPGTDRSPGVWRYPSERKIHWRYDPGNSGIDFSSTAAGGYPAPGTPFALNTWYYVGVIKNGATATAYVNGLSVGSVAVSSPKISGSTPVIINEYYANQLNNMNCVMVYNRVLTGAEVQQNFNALRGRFGI